MTIIKNCTLHTMEDAPLEKATIIIKDGKIDRIGTDIDLSAYDAATVIDAKNNIVTPGLVDPHCHVGIAEEGIQFEGNDTNEMTHPIYPELRGLDSFYPHDTALKKAMESGVTTVVSGPGSANVIGGTFDAYKTVGETVDDMLLREKVTMKMALGENPKRVYSGQKKSPSTRMASAALMREWLTRAQEYHAKHKTYEQSGATSDKPAFDMKLHSLMPVFEGLRVKIHAHRSDDIMTAIRIGKEFNLDITIDHGSEAHLIPESVRRSGYPVILGPTLVAASKYEVRNKSFASAKILDDYNIPFAIMTDHPVVGLEHTLVQLALFVKGGLDPEKAMRTVTIDAAKLNKIDDRVGSLKKGKDADIVIWDNDPLNILTKPTHVFIDGKLVHKQ